MTGKNAVILSGVLTKRRNRRCPRTIQVEAKPKESKMSLDNLATPKVLFVLLEQMDTSTSLTFSVSMTIKLSMTEKMCYVISKQHEDS